MAVVKRIVCLANSKKMSGRCVAGREVGASGPGPWVRPVTSRPSEELSEIERMYEDGSEPRLLDVIDVPLLQHRPHACQTENWLLNPEQYWRRVRRVDWNELAGYVENPPTLWRNGHSTHHGVNDEIPQTEADRLPGSLCLTHVPGVELVVFAPSLAFGNPKRKVQVRFRHAGATYALMLTDPLVERNYLARDDGTYPLGECCLTISLSEPFQKSGHSGEYFRYKLVAAIIVRT